MTDKQETAEQAELKKEKQGSPPSDKDKRPTEIGGRDGPEPTRYGDWEKNGIISDF